MKKILCLTICLLLLTGCGKSAPEDTVPTTQPSQPEDTTTGTYLLTEQVHYDANDRVNVRMEVAFNEQQLPTSVLLDSGVDVTYTPQYDENGNITGFSTKRVLYGEETEGTASVNDHGDIVQKIANGKTTDVTLSYDDSGRVIKKETSVDGSLSSVKTWAYDEQGNLSKTSSTDENGGYTLVYENTYNGTLLTAIHCKFDGGDTEHTESFTYDENGQLTKWEQVSGDETTTTVYTYNEQGLTATELNLLNGEEFSRLEYSYNENGLLSEKRTYSYGEFSGRTTYSWTAQPILLTAAQRNVLKQLGVLL